MLQEGNIAAGSGQCSPGELLQGINYSASSVAQHNSMTHNCSFFGDVLKMPKPLPVELTVILLIRVYDFEPVGIEHVIVLLKLFLLRSINRHPFWRM